MRIIVGVKTNADKNEIWRITPAIGSTDPHFAVTVKELPEKDKANYAVLKLLSEHLEIPIASMKIVSGSTSRRKVIVIKEGG